MSIKLRQSTASQEVPLGHFLDSTDGNTEETGLAIANTDIKVWKTGATSLANKNSGGGTHMANGVYSAVMDATDTDTLGPLVVFVHVSGALPVRLECDVIPADTYDGMYSVVGPSPDDGILDKGTAQSASSTGIVLRSAAAFADDTLIGAIVMALGSTQGYWQTRQITDNALSEDTVTVDPAWTVTPSGTITYKLLGGPPAPTGTPVPVNATQINGVAITSTAGRPEVNVTHAAGTAWNSGGIGAATLAADTLTAAKVASDVGTEIGTAVWATGTRVLTAGTNLNDLSAAGVRSAVGLASANLDTQLAAIDDFLDTEVAAILAVVDTEVGAIKTKTDSLTFTVANQVDVNVIDWKGATAPAMTGDAFARLGAPVGASISADIAGISAGSGPTAAEIADAVWEEDISDHSGTSGSTAEALNAAGAAGDPWITTLPGSYSAGQAGFILGTNLDAVVSTRATQTSVTTIDDFLDTEVADIQARLPAALVSGRIDASVGAMAANVLTAAATAADFTTEVTASVATSSALTTVAGEVTAVKAKTDGLPSDPADASVVAGLIGTVQTAVDAILLDTGTDGVVVAAGSKSGYALSTAGVDAVLDDAVDGSTTVRESLRLANAVLAGKASGLGTTEVTFRDLADTKDRIVATVDGVDGNRTAVTRDLS